MKGEFNVKSRRKIRVGLVTSDKTDKTITVNVERQFAHPLYKKIIKKSKKFMAHDESNEAHVGDRVKIVESRPISAQKRWKLVEIVERAK
jgi:small subunit ribosomal protein S17